MAQEWPVPNCAFCLSVVEHLSAWRCAICSQPKCTKCPTSKEDQPLCPPCVSSARESAFTRLLEERGIDAAALRAEVDRDVEALQHGLRLLRQQVSHAKGMPPEALPLPLAPVAPAAPPPHAAAPPRAPAPSEQFQPVSSAYIAGLATRLRETGLELEPAGFVAATAVAPLCRRGGIELAELMFAGVNLGVSRATREHTRGWRGLRLTPAATEFLNRPVVKRPRVAPVLAAPPVQQLPQV